MNESQLEPPDEALIAMMGRREDDLDSAKAAFRIFFNRHCDYLYQHLLRVDYQFDGHAIDAEDLVQDVFAKVWRTGHRTYKPENRAAGVATLSSTRAWLTQIAYRLFLNQLRREPITPIDPGGDNEDLFEEPRKGEQIKNAIAIRQLVDASLCELDVKILWFKMNYYDPETGESKPDRDAVKHFCERWNLTEPAFRKRYSRAIDTLAKSDAATQLSPR